MEKQCEIPGCVMQDFLFCEMLEKNENWNLSNYSNVLKQIWQIWQIWIKKLQVASLKLQINIETMQSCHFKL